jgi:tetratricopeptide (TPR) repeat protein
MCNQRYHRTKQETVGGGGRQVPRKNPRTLAEWFEHGRRCFYAPDGTGAIQAMLKVTRNNPGYRHTDGDNPYYYLGKIHEVEGRLQHAIVFYSRALAVDPLDEDSLIGLGTCHTVTGQHGAAIHDFEYLLRFPKGRRKIPQKHLFFMLSENYRRDDNWVQAIFWGQLAEDADPGNESQRELYESLLAAVAENGYMIK